MKLCTHFENGVHETTPTDDCPAGSPRRIYCVGCRLAWRWDGQDYVDDGEVQP
jgi:hypothetical protein